MTLEQLTDEDRDAVWRTTDMNDTDMQEQILKSLQGAAADMKYADRKFFLDRLAALFSEQTAVLTDRHVDLVKEICSTGRDDEKCDEVAQRGLELLWTVAFESGKQ